MLGLKREIIYDKDGTFTNKVFDGTTRVKSTILNGFKHILAESGCKNTTS